MRPVRLIRESWFVSRATRLMTLATAALTLAAVAAPPASAAVPAPDPGFDLVFADDFTGSAGSSVNGANWRFDLGTGYPGGPSNWGTGEVETMTNSTQNVFVDGAGHLRIRPVRDGSGRWTSGRIETNRTDFAAPSGGRMRVRASIQVPNVTGAAAAGYWPAFWMLGSAFRGVFTNWPGVGEIDVMENINGLNTQFGTLHCGVAPGGPCNENTGRGGTTQCSVGGSCQATFHTYEVTLDRSVSPERLIWALDGATFFTLSADQVGTTAWNNATHHGFFLILDVAMGGAFPAAFGGGPTAATQSGIPMVVDYVAVYQDEGDGDGDGGGGSPPTGTIDAYSRIQAEGFADSAGVSVEQCFDVGGGSDIGTLSDGDWALYPDVDFGTGPAVRFDGRVASGAAGGISGLVEVRLDSRSNPPAGTFAIANTGGWQSWRTVPGSLPGVSGTHDVYLTFTSGQPADFVNVNWFTFARG